MIRERKRKRESNNHRLSILNFILILLRITLKFIFNPNKIIIKLKEKKQLFYNRILNHLWSSQAYILKNLPDTNLKFYRSNYDIIQLEHQVGRYLNMKKIVTEIKNEGIDGDIVEFGTWQGLGLMILNQCFGKHNRKLIGIDSFKGLPETSTTWLKGQFNNTSLKYAYQNISTYTINEDSFRLIKGWFNDKSVAKSLYKETTSVSLVHFDADLGSSTTQALNMIEPYLKNRIQPIFFLFDDWGCQQDEVPDAFLNWLLIAQNTYNFKAHKFSTTKLTRYYKITFN